ncbi:sensor histidine kinase [Campylobacter pinnipediorum]|uniref:sensor histidine kinase n=1 Tax=Campylobacter pinnipediorum TaxID=1965231 RepID=UPI0009C1D5E0|nr:cache domain-containing protein [Campylobacter pinnipediorum]AQW82510.1 two-component system sensor histidine kinase [Campylobacter pinnipediorum subsp. pinnipediorum]
MHFLNEKNLKFYTIIIILSMLVVFLGVNMYNNAKYQITTLLNKNSQTTSQNIVEVFHFWLNERISLLSSASKFIEASNVLQDEEKIKKFTKIFLKGSASGFDLIQILNKDGELYINGEKIINEYERKTRLNLIWYLDTKENLKPTVNFMPTHTILKEKTLNICVPNYKNNKFEATICGVVRLESLFKNINNFKLQPNSYSFIVTHSGEILTKINDLNLKNKIQNKFKSIFLIDEDITSLQVDSNFISISEIPSLNWYIGAGTNNKEEINKLLSTITKNAILVLFAFILLAALANFLHNLMYEKIKKSKDEYELLLSHKAKMSEAGELITGINHQFIQPVNSLNLMISTLLMLKKEGNLEDGVLESMLSKGQKSIVLLNNTIEIFRNFYKTTENISEFSIKQSIQNLLTLMHTELARANVHIVLDIKDDKQVNQIENIIQQILLILIHNAKDALVDKFKNDIQKRKITISVKFSNLKCYIKVSEFGSGINEIMIGKIFSQPKTTKKYGNGIGLYFGKKLANEKINGDIKLIKNAEPTEFELSFDINLKSKKENL